MPGPPQPVTVSFQTTSTSANTYSGNTGFFVVNPETTNLQVALSLTPPSQTTFPKGDPFINITAQDQLPGTRTYVCGVNSNVSKTVTQALVAFTASVSPPVSSIGNLPTPMQVTIVLTYGGGGRGSDDPTWTTLESDETPEA